MHVVIPVFNRPQEVKELLDSFLSLEGNYQYEIVIVEDGSTQSSEHILEEFNRPSERILLRKLRYYVHQRLIGSTGALRR